MWKPVWTLQSCVKDPHGAELSVQSLPFPCFNFMVHSLAKSGFGRQCCWCWLTFLPFWAFSLTPTTTCGDPKHAFQSTELVSFDKNLLFGTFLVLLRQCCKNCGSVLRLSEITVHERTWDHWELSSCYHHITVFFSSFQYSRRFAMKTARLPRSVGLGPLGVGFVAVLNRVVSAQSGVYGAHWAETSGVSLGGSVGLMGHVEVIFLAFLAFLAPMRIFWLQSSNPSCFTTLARYHGIHWWDTGPQLWSSQYHLHFFVISWALLEASYTCKKELLSSLLLFISFAFWRFISLKIYCRTSALPSRPSEKQDMSMLDS